MAKGKKSDISKKTRSFFKSPFAKLDILCEHFPQLLKVINEENESFDSLEEYTTVLDLFLENTMKDSQFVNHDHSEISISSSLS